MKRIAFISQVLIIGLCLQTPVLFAQDQDPNKKDTKEAKGSAHAGKREDKTSQEVQKGATKSLTSKGDKSRGDVNSRNSADAYRSTNAGTENTKMATRSIQQTDQRQSRQTGSPAFAVRGNQSNHYNGQWVAGNTHSDWGRNGYHQWNNHDYRWYDGGWLIIDAGYYQTGSIVREVKESLAQDGYYTGHINDRFGPRTRQAISNYESDNDLPGNGSINEPLLVSLGIE